MRYSLRDDLLLKIAHPTQVDFIRLNNFTLAKQLNREYSQNVVGSNPDKIYKTVDILALDNDAFVTLECFENTLLSTNMMNVFHVHSTSEQEKEKETQNIKEMVNNVGKQELVYSIK